MPEVPLIDPARLAQLLFLSAFSVSVSLVLRVAHDWYPFTPTYTDDRRWWGWRDLIRWGLAGVLMFIVPFIYLAWALVAIAKSGIVVPLTAPTLREVLGVISLILLPIPLLGFYDIWQSIVRSNPAFFYSPQASRKIEDRYDAAFTSNRLSTFFLGIAWIIVPLVVFHAFAALHASPTK